MIRVAGIVAVVLALLGASSAQALRLEPVGGDFDEPTYVTSDPGDAGRLFVVERKGTIWLIEKESRANSPISARRSPAKPNARASAG